MGASRPAPVQESVEHAVRLLQAGRLDEGEALLRAVREQAPDNPDVLHFLGMLAYQHGRAAECIELLRRATSIAPDYAAALNNLGNILKLQGRPGEAEDCYRRLLAIHPDDTNAWCNLGVVLRSTRDLEGAETALRRAISIMPNHVPAYNNLGNVLSDLGRADEAVECHLKSVAFDPDHPDGPRLLGRALYVAGRIDEAREVYRAWLARQPDNALAAHMLAACAGGEAPARAADDYVRVLFDEFANDFDDTLALLDYRAPKLVAAMIAGLLPAPSADLCVLDAGCGTGLCAQALRPYASRLVGVDLSAGMLHRAAIRGGYDDLAECELTEHLRMHERVYDLVVCADTLCYFGALDDVLAAMARALVPGGRLVFTVELAADPAPESGFRLGPHGRYSHSQVAVVTALSRAGMESIHIGEAILRQEVNKPVNGLIVSASVSVEHAR